MRQVITPLTVALFLAATFPTAARENPAGAAFTYQGKLTQNGLPPASLTADLRFRLFDAEVDGSQIGGELAAENVLLSDDGTFTVDLNFGLKPFVGSQRWLEIDVRSPHDPGDTDPYETLSPRQPIMHTPYALFALNAANSSSTWMEQNGQVITNDNVGIGTKPEARLHIKGDETNPARIFLERANTFPNEPAWVLNLDEETGEFTIGRMNPEDDDVTLRDFHVEPYWNGSVTIAEGLRVEGTPWRRNIVGGYQGNSITKDVQGGTISGGGSPFAGHIVTDEFGSIGGGEGNQAGNANEDLNDAGFATVGGGVGNIASGQGSTISGGSQNEASGEGATAAGGVRNTADGDGAAVGGGHDNFATSSNSTVSGGYENRAWGLLSAIGGGNRNLAEGTASTVSGGSSNYATKLWATVGGGEGNVAVGIISTVSGGYDNKASGDRSSVGGGETNFASGGTSTIAGGFRNSASGRFSSVPGGSGNSAGGDYSFAAGRNATVRTEFLSGDSNGDEGTFVWADSGTDVILGTPFISTGPDQFLIRAKGGVGIGTNQPSQQLHVNGNVRVDGWIGTDINASLDMYVNNSRGLRIEPADPYGEPTPNIIGGSPANFVSKGVGGATINGGGFEKDQLKSINRITDNFGTIGGGAGNQAGDDHGETNVAIYATVGGGTQNVSAGWATTISGGSGNTAVGDNTTISGGSRNRVELLGSTIGGGVSNDGRNAYSTISGGFGNRANGRGATIGGGTSNSAIADRSTVPGGIFNIAGGRYSLAAGRFAQVRDAKQSGDPDGDEGTFVWADSGDDPFGTEFQSTGPDQFLIRASGGVGIGTNAPTSQLHVNGSISKAITTVTADITLDFSHSVIIVDASSADVTVILPSVATCEGRVYTIKRKDPTATLVTLSADGSETIDGSPSQFLTNKYHFLTVISDGSNWFIIGRS